ncbi:MAG TPA: HlyD family efflux transporter periplasmic adaptor subunit [Verrucomicrobiae bacterium]|nr:HlyD family efflux transporter periplasmic adaptor subunit [Verrucomicrobiae bacterium]
MSSDSNEPIPIPAQQRWCEIRQRTLPAIVFASAIVVVVLLWKDHTLSRVMVGQAEPILSNVSSYKPGVVTELQVNRFQRIKQGDPICRIMVTEPRILASSIAVIQAEIESLRANMRPVTMQQHNAMSYDQLQLDWMRERTQLASARVNLELAGTEFHRTEELFKDKIVSERAFDQAKAARDRLRDEVANLEKLVQDGEKSLQMLQLTNSQEIGSVSIDPLRAAIAVQESKLHLTEAELSPITVTAPIDGIVNTIFHRAGESITPGQPIVTVATLSPSRIVGYLRPPIGQEPKPGMTVEVRTRGLPRVVGSARILEVGTQLETVPPILIGPMKIANTELGLPVEISLPEKTNGAGERIPIRAGELVDIVMP